MPNARLAFDKGQAFFEQRKWDEALAAFRVAVDKDPEMSEGWYQIGMAEMLKNGGFALLPGNVLGRLADGVPPGGTIGRIVLAPDKHDAHFDLPSCTHCRQGPEQLVQRK